MNHGKFIWYFCFILVICFCFISIVPLASASDTVNDETIPVETTATSEPIVIETVPEDEVLPTEPSPDDSYYFVGSNIVTSVAPVTPSNSNGFKAVLVGLLGNYDPVVVEYQYQSSNGYYSYLREIQPDYAWMCGAAIFLVVIFCIFRILGGVICGRK